MSKASRARKAAKDDEGCREEAPEAETTEEATPEVIDTSDEDGPESPE